MKFLSWLFKTLFGLVIILTLIGGIFTAFNWTLVKNMRGFQEGGFDAYFTERHQPRQLVKGTASSTDIVLENVSNDRFSSVIADWKNTGGKALLVWHNGELVVEDYADGITANDLSKTFSLHKSVLGLTAAAVQAEGLMDLDASLSNYLPELGGKPLGAFTLRDMLTHQTGLERFPMSPPSLKSLNLLLSHKVERTALKAKVSNDNPKFDYANPNYQIAGAAIRRVIKEKTGLSYADYVSDRMWQKIGASDAYLWAETEAGAPRFYAGFLANAKDWLRLGIMLAENDGSILPRSAMETYLTPAALNPDYGLGIWLGVPEDLSREYGPSTPLAVQSKAPFLIGDMVFMDGFGGQRVYISQSEKLVIVRIGDVRFDWDDTALPNLVTKALGIGGNTLQISELTLEASNERAVSVRILAPNRDCSDCGLIIFSHGAFASNADYDGILKPLAGLGYKVAIPLHVDSKSHANFANYTGQEWTKLRLEDVKVITEYLMKDGKKNWIMAGHSFGAMIAQIYGGGGSEKTTSRESALGLPTHIISLSPPGEVPQIFTRKSAVNIDVPTLLVTGDQDLVPGIVEKWEGHLMSHQSAPEGITKAVIFVGHDHYFNGFYGRPKEAPKTAQTDALIRLLTAFIKDRPLKGGEGYELRVR